MDPIKALSGLFSSILLGGVLGFIFYVLLGGLDLLPDGPFDVEMVEAIVIGAALAVGLRVLGSVAG